MDIKVNNHSSIIINNEIYIDPFKIKENLNNAKLIFLTHNHYDHLSLEDIDKVINEETIIICTESCINNLKNYKNTKIIVKPNYNYNISGIKFNTFASYNINKKFHKKEDGNVGYILNIENNVIAILGDTDVTNEVKNLKCDILLIPIGGKFTMNALEASNLANLIKPKLVIPIHYNSIIGTKDDEKVFIENLDKNINYKILL